MPKLTAQSNHIYIGIDPGASGGLAALNGRVIASVPMPETEADIWQWVKYQAEWLRAHDEGAYEIVPACAVLESNTGYVGDSGNPGSAMFKFGRSAGLLEMALIAAGIPYELVTPARWQKALGIPTRKRDAKGQFKSRLKAFAQRLFPHVTVTLKTCDALLIAEYCRRKQEGRLAR